MALPEVTYLTTDSLAEGVGASQVLRYAELLARRGVRVRLHTFEKSPSAPALRARLRDAGVPWRAHAFGAYGPRGGLGRVARAAVVARRAPLLHARGDLAAAAALVARTPRWIWDMRALFVDQRLALGALAARSPEERVLRAVERGAARRSTAIIALAEAVRPVIEERHGVAAAAKLRVIPTAVDLALFPAAPLPAYPLRLLLSGTLNRYYDVPLMLDLVRRVGARRPATLAVLTRDPSPWDAELAAVGAERAAVAPDKMPGQVAASHAGLSVCRVDAGPSLRAAVPTKLAEFLASGRPVVVNRGLGDMDELIARYRCGVVVGDDLDQAADALLELLDDAGTPARCRACAEEHFALDRAVDRVLELYTAVATGACIAGNTAAAEDRAAP